MKHDEWEINKVKNEEHELKQMEKDLERHQKNIMAEEHGFQESWGDDSSGNE